MYRVVFIDGFIKKAICMDGKPDRYGIPMTFKTRKAAEKWIAAHSYPGMSFRYELKEIMAAFPGGKTL